MRGIVAAFVGCALPLTASLLLTNANPRGKTVFEKRCTGCHALDQDREGPRLGGVYGRASGAIAGFPYSPALAKAHIVWNEATLEQWLTDPESLVPGNNMDFHIPRPQERRDVIEFLKQRVNK
jgi:cytochrome c